MADEIPNDIQKAIFRQKTLRLAITMRTDVIVTMNAASCQSDFM